MPLAEMLISGILGYGLGWKGGVNTGVMSTRVLRKRCKKSYKQLKKMRNCILIHKTETFSRLSIACLLKSNSSHRS